MKDRDVPYIVFESEMTRLERMIKRLAVLLALVIALLFLSNIAWLTFFNQFDFDTTTTTQETQGNANYIGASGNINNGVPKSSEDKNDTSPPSASSLL